MASPLISLRNIDLHYRAKEKSVSVLRGVNWSVRTGESCALLGPSGSGKSTLLHIIGMLDRPTAGTFYFDDMDVLQADSNTRAWVRNQKIGFVFQSFNLLPKLSALENVALPLTYRGINRRQAQQRAMELLELVGMQNRATHRPAELSGGQLQRAAIARALIGSPSLILADEPTGNLDNDNAKQIVDLLLRLNASEGVTLIVVTHDAQMATRFERQYCLQAGQLQQMSAVSRHDG